MFPHFRTCQTYTTEFGAIHRGAEKGKGALIWDIISHENSIEYFAQEVKHIN